MLLQHDAGGSGETLPAPLARVLHRHLRASADSLFTKGGRRPSVEAPADADKDKDKNKDDKDKNKDDKDKDQDQVREKEAAAAAAAAAAAKRKAAKHEEERPSKKPSLVALPGKIDKFARFRNRCTFLPSS